MPEAVGHTEVLKSLSMSVGLVGLLAEKSQQEISDTKLGPGVKLTELDISKESLTFYYCHVKNVDIV